MVTISDKNRKNCGSEKYRDFDLERIVDDMLISQYQAHILKSKLTNRLAGGWVLSQDRDYDSSSFTFDHHGKKFKVSSSVIESTPIDE